MKNLEIKIFKTLLERFGQKVGMLPPGPMVGVRDERDMVETGGCGCDSPTCTCNCEACGGKTIEKVCPTCGIDYY